MKLNEWINNLLANGKTAFGIDDAKQLYGLTEVAIKRSLANLTAKGDILSVYKGYNIIIPLQYRTRGVLPPALFIEGLAKFLKRPYCVGLLNAAAFYGAAHHQPQEYFVFTNKRSVSDLFLEKKGNRNRFPQYFKSCIDSDGSGTI